MSDTFLTHLEALIDDAKRQKHQGLKELKETYQQTVEKRCALELAVEPHEKEKEKKKLEKAIQELQYRIIQKLDCFKVLQLTHQKNHPLETELIARLNTTAEVEKIKDFINEKCCDVDNIKKRMDKSYDDITCGFNTDDDASWTLKVKPNDILGDAYKAQGEAVGYGTCVQPPL